MARNNRRPWASRNDLDNHWRRLDVAYVVNELNGERTVVAPDEFFWTRAL